MGFRRRVRVLVLVKAAPQPSSTYGDTVCVAGIVLGGQPDWMRLYPVPFRYLDGARQFRKYDVVEVEVRPAGADKRPESRKINADSIRIVDHLDGWPKRSRWVEPLAVESMCDVIRTVRQNRDSRSLAAVRPAAVTDLLLEPHPGWSPDQLARFERFAQQARLFEDAPPQMLEPPRFKGRYRYRCGDSACRWHEQGILDWEFTALQRRFRSESDQALERILRRNFYQQMFQRETTPLLFVGNQENPVKRHVFSVLGVYYPKAGTTAPADVLF